jgi:hypothetical protein
VGIGAPSEIGGEDQKIDKPCARPAVLARGFYFAEKQEENAQEVMGKSQQVTAFDNRVFKETFKRKC